MGPGGYDHDPAMGDFALAIAGDAGNADDLAGARLQADINAPWGAAHSACLRAAAWRPAST
jgi:hypothetical protein